MRRKERPGDGKPDEKEGEEGEEKRIAYAPTMVPGIVDKQGDVIPGHVIEASAHDFMKDERGIDAITISSTAKGQPVESWICKEERSFELPSGESKTYPKGPGSSV